MTKKRELPPDRADECAKAHALFLAKKNVLGLSQKKIADAADMTPAAVNLYFKGINPLNLQFAAVLSEQLQESIEAFSPRLAKEAALVARVVANKKENGGNVIAADFTAGRKDLIDIPRLEVGGSMGKGLARPDDYEDVVDRIRVSTGWLRKNVNATNHSNLAVITGYGDSMAPTFTDGDMLLVDRGITEIKIDAVHVLSLRGELYIKRIQRRPDGSYLMISDNAKYPPYEIKSGDLSDFEVLGRVLMAWNANRL